ncbi:GNAT family N-acetyltransferase [Chitinimonas sp.]|uniref:GNAT family N-acetyltransferase n=1 Tax=Chitinimonas sp. TaxID=1934313 RepID=UPI002F9240F3
MFKHAIRPAFLLDIPALLYLYTQFDSEPQPIVEPHAAMLQFERIKNMGEVLVAEADGQIVGCCSLYICSSLLHGARPFGLIEHVVVDPGHRRQGMGRALLQEALQIAASRNCYTVMLSSSSLRSEEHAFYAACGFDADLQGFQRKLKKSGQLPAG